MTGVAMMAGAPFASAGKRAQCKAACADAVGLCGADDSVAAKSKRARRRAVRRCRRKLVRRCRRRGAAVCQVVTTTTTTTTSTTSTSTPLPSCPEYPQVGGTWRGTVLNCTQTCYPGLPVDPTPVTGPCPSLPAGTPYQITIEQDDSSVCGIIHAGNFGGKVYPYPGAHIALVCCPGFLGVSSSSFGGRFTGDSIVNAGYSSQARASALQGGCDMHVGLSPLVRDPEP